MTDYAVLNQAEDEIESVGRLSTLFPSVKFPASGPSEDWLIERNTYQVKTSIDYDANTERLVIVPPYIAGPGDVRSVQIEQLTFSEIKSRKLVALSVQFKQKRDSGVVVSGYLFSTTNDGHQELKALKERLDRVGGTQKAITRAGDMIEADATQATAIFTAVDDYIAACWSREYDLRVEINAATDVTELEAIDITSGWPVSEQPQ